MNTDNLVTAEQLAGALKMAVEGTKKKPGLITHVPHLRLKVRSPSGGMPSKSSSLR